MAGTTAWSRIVSRIAAAGAMILCRYAQRRTIGVIDAIAVNEAAFEKNCVQ